MGDARRAWLVVNPGSHSTSEAETERVREALTSRGVDIVHETRFPNEDMPRREDLEREQIDLFILFGGDGTITCGATEADGWHGDILILPGGTMNLIPKEVHGSAEPADIAATALDGGELRPLAYVEAEGHRSFARLIAGPAAGFVHLRERVRWGRFAAIWRAFLFAWRLTWSRTIRIQGQPGHYRAIFVDARDDGKLYVDAIEAAGLLTVIRLAIAWVSGNLAGSSALARLTLDEVVIEAARPVHILFDGEEQIMEAPVRLTARMTPPQFVATEVPS